MKDTLIKVKNNLQRINIEWMMPRIESAIWNNRKQKIPNQTGKKKKKNPKQKTNNPEDSGRRLWDNFKHTNIHIRGVPEGEEKEQEIGNLFEKIIKLP